MIKKENYILSIIIPVYNSEKYITNTIEHISRICVKTEIIVINDGSKDKTLEICRNLQNKYSNLFVYSQENKGVSAARNHGIEKAQGKWIFFCDADDWVDSQNIENIINIAEAYNDKIILAGMNFVKINGVFYHPVPDNIDFSPMNFLNSTYFQGSSCNYLFPLELIKKNNIYFPVGIVNTEDQNFNIKCIACSNGVYSINIPIYNYNHLNETAAHKRNKSFKWKIGPLESSINIIDFCFDNKIEVDLVSKQVNRLVEDYYRDHIYGSHSSKELALINKLIQEIGDKCSIVRTSLKYKAISFNTRLGISLLKIYNRIKFKR